MMNSVDHTRFNFNDHSELHYLVTLHNVGSHIKFPALLKMFIKETNSHYENPQRNRDSQLD